MGILGRIFGRSPRDERQPPSQKQKSEPQKQHQGEWEYLADPSDLIKTGGSWGGMDFSLNVKDAVPANATQYMQDLLSTFDEDTIDVRIVLPKNVRHAPAGWQYLDGQNNAQVIDSFGRLLGNMPDYKLSKTGYSIGDTARAAITKPPAGGTHYGLHILVPKELIETLNRKQERARIERAVGGKVPENVETATRNIDDSKWLGPRNHGSPKRAEVKTSLIPVPSGSKAKPHICVSLEGIELFEATARMECYKILAKHVGEIPFCATYQRFDSMSENENYYWKLTIVYEF